MKFTVEWVKAALIRAVRTAAQVALTMLTVGMAVNEVEWMKLLSVSAVAAVYSILTSIVTDLPEVGSDGTIVLDSDGEITTLDIPLNTEELAKKGSVRLSVTNDK